MVFPSFSPLKPRHLWALGIPMDYPRADYPSRNGAETPQTAEMRKCQMSWLFHGKIAKWHAKSSMYLSQMSLISICHVFSTFAKFNWSESLGKDSGTQGWYHRRPSSPFTMNFWVCTDTMPRKRDIDYIDIRSYYVYFIEREREREKKRKSSYIYIY